MRPHLILAVPLLVSATAWADAPRSAIDWLNRMSAAAHALNYEGTFTYEQAGRLQTMEIYHDTDGEHERERLVALDGASREVVRKEGKVTCILPDRKSKVVDEVGVPTPLPINVPTRVDQLESFYQPTVGGEERIAGHVARKITITPRDAYRYGQHLWLDANSGLLLKAQTRDEKGKVVEQLIFSRLQIHDGPLPAKMVESQAPEQDLRLLSQEQGAPADAAVESPWAVTQLPAGFREESRRYRNLPGVPVLVEHRLFTDGFASVSVYIEPVKGEKRPPARSVRQGALNVYTRYLPDYKVTVLGEVPDTTVRLIGDGVAAHGAGVKP